MMPRCDYTKRILFWTWHCRQIASHIHVTNDHIQIAACDKHEHWYRIQIEAMGGEDENPS